MNILDFALRHPLTIIVVAISIALGSFFAVNHMRTDVFPNLNQPVIYVAQPYGGMDPAQMEGLITNYYEYAFLFMNSIKRVESYNVQNFALVKLYFQPGTNMAQAVAESAIYANRAKAFFPPGTVTPFIMQLDASMVPVAYVTLSSDTRSIDELADLMLFRIRPKLASLPGTTAPQPFGGSLRSIVVNLDPNRLRTYNLSPDVVAQALNTGNIITPSGNARVRDQMPIVSVNSIVVDPKKLGDIPIIPTRDIYLRDLGTVQDTTDIPTGWALVNGKRAVYMPILKTADASTLTVARQLRNNLDDMRSVLPKDCKLDMEFDQSPYVTGAVGGVVQESFMGAILTGLMVLLFLGDWRSVIVVITTIPLSLMGSLIGLFITGQSINLMTLGGLSLAVGILVDEATVAVENIHTQMGASDSIARAVLIGTGETVVPRLLAMLCILAVFVPAFLMEGAARNLFIPLSLAVGFAMISSFLLSSTFVPVISVWLLRHSHADHHGRLLFPHRFFQWLLVLSRAFKAITPAAFFPMRLVHSLIRRFVLTGRVTAERFTFVRFQGRYSAFLTWVLTKRRTVIPIYLGLALLVIGTLGPQIGREISPQVDAGQFQMRIKAPVGSRLEVTEDLTRETMKQMEELFGRHAVKLSVAHIGQTAPTLTANIVFLWTSGPDQAVIRIALEEEAGLHIEEVEETLREELPKRLKPWLVKCLERYGASPKVAKARAEEFEVSFEPADVINQVMSFGSPTPVDIAISGPNQDDNRAFAAKVKREMAKIKTLRDLKYGQSFDYPRIKVEVDRERTGKAGLTVADASNAMIEATSSSRYIYPIYWADPSSGIGYQVQLQVPPAQMDSTMEVGMIPVKNQEGKAAVLLRDVATVTESTMPQEYDRVNQRRIVSISANVVGEDLGRAITKIEAAIKRAGTPPRGVKIGDEDGQIRGQVPAMYQMFSGLASGLVLSVVVVFLMLTAYFQSFKLAFVSVATTPAVVAGVTIALYITHTTLNINSFMGSIMSVGVAVANAILLTTFAENARQTGMDAPTAARTGARERLRPIIMTSCAMIAGMIPMALGLGEGGAQGASLGRAVIGGLTVATGATLLILPSVFSIVMGSAKIGSPSLHPDDPDGAHYSPESAALAGHAHGHSHPVGSHAVETHGHGHGAEGHPADPHHG